MSVEILKKYRDYKCSSCGSTNIRYTHDFNPMTLVSIISFTCKDCGEKEFL